MTFNLLDLFSGIGGFSLGLERSGYFETKAFCEIDPFCRKVLAKHWPKVPYYHDIRELSGERLVRDVGRIDAICGGFPCQDISFAGLGAGIEGARSGLWSEYARLIGEIRPRFVIVENVAALLGRGMGRVLGDLAAIGYDAEWDCKECSEIGLPHLRDRWWMVAYPSGFRWNIPENKTIFDLAWQRLPYSIDTGEYRWERKASRHSMERVAWSVEPDICGSVHGVSVGLDDSKRIHALGNAVVPQIPEIIGRAIGEAFR